VVQGGGKLFFQLVNARYERGAMILTSNRNFGGLRALAARGSFGIGSIVC